MNMNVECVCSSSFREIPSFFLHSCKNSSQRGLHHSNVLIISSSFSHSDRNSRREFSGSQSFGSSNRKLQTWLPERRDSPTEAAQSSLAPLSGRKKGSLSDVESKMSKLNSLNSRESHNNDSLDYNDGSSYFDELERYGLNETEYLPPMVSASSANSPQVGSNIYGSPSRELSGKGTSLFLRRSRKPSLKSVKRSLDQQTVRISKQIDESNTWTSEVVSGDEDGWWVYCIVSGVNEETFVGVAKDVERRWVFALCSLNLFSPVFFTQFPSIRKKFVPPQYKYSIFLFLEFFNTMEKHLGVQNIQKTEGRGF